MRRIGKPSRVEAAQDARGPSAHVAVDDHRADVVAAVEAVVGGRDDAEVAQGDRAAGTPRDARHPTGERRRDRVIEPVKPLGTALAAVATVHATRTATTTAFTGQHAHP